MNVATTTPKKSPSVRVTLEQIHLALERNDLDTAEKALNQFGEPLPSDFFEPLGLVHIMRGRWSQAAQALGRVRQPSMSVHTLRRYAANLAALQTCHPHAFDVVAACAQSDRYQIDQPDTGLATILRVDTHGHAQPVVIGPTPEKHLATSLEAMTRSNRFNACFGLAGIGDGNVLAAFLDQFPPDNLGIELPLFVIEPDPQLAQAVLMLHDLSDTDGPIRNPRIQWCVGPDWQNQLKMILKKDTYLPPPTIMIQLTPEGRSVTQEAKRLYHEVEAVGKPAYDEADFRL